MGLSLNRANIKAKLIFPPRIWCHFSEVKEVHAFSFSSFWYEWMALSSWIGRLHRPRLTETLYSQHVLNVLPTSIPPSQQSLVSFWDLCDFVEPDLTASQSGVEWTKPIIPSHPLNWSDGSNSRYVNWADHTVFIGGFLGMLKQNCSLWHKKKAYGPKSCKQLSWD